MSAGLAAGDEDHVPLARVGILLLQKEELVDAVLSEGRNLDDCANWSGEALFEDKVFPSADLGNSWSISATTTMDAEPPWQEPAWWMATYPLEQTEKVFPGLIPDLVDAEAYPGSHGELQSPCRSACLKLVGSVDRRTTGCRMYSSARR